MSWPGLSRPSTSLSALNCKTWMPGTRPGMTVENAMSACSLFRAHPDRKNGRHGRLCAGGDGDSRTRRPLDWRPDGDAAGRCWAGLCFPCTRSRRAFHCAECGCEPCDQRGQRDLRLGLYAAGANALASDQHVGSISCLVDPREHCPLGSLVVRAGGSVERHCLGHLPVAGAPVASRPG